MIQKLISPIVKEKTAKNIEKTEKVPTKHWFSRTL